MSARRSTSKTLAAISLLIAATVPFAPPAAAATTCFGKQPTIVGTNVGDQIEGTGGNGADGEDTADGGSGDDACEGVESEQSCES